MIPPHLLPAYEECRRIQQHHGKTYYFSTLLFPKDVRPHVNALYGFVRYPDELVDNPVHATIPERCRAVRQFRMQTIQAHANKSVENPILHAFGHTMRTMGIQLKDALDFLDAMESDLTISRYKTYAELQRAAKATAPVTPRVRAEGGSTAERVRQRLLEQAGAPPAAAPPTRSVGAGPRR
ncbi:MAG: squalene/phytoene synthase family protein [Nanoarchaeota archaeon]